MAARARNTNRRAVGFTLQVHVTSACDSRCVHCYQRDAVPCHMAPGDFRMLMGQYRALAHMLEGGWGAPVRPLVTITGGEPLLHPAFRDLVRSAWGHGFDVAVLTNGHFVDDETARFLRGAEFVQVSLDGDREVHDRIRGAGDFERTMAAIRALSREGAYAMASFTAHAGNYRSLPAAARAARRAGAKRFWSDRYLPIDPSAQLVPLDRRQTGEWLALLGKAARWHGATVARHRALQFLCGGVCYRCHAGRDLLAVTESCEVLPCRRLPVGCGDFRETPLAEIYAGNADLRAMRSFSQPGACASCRHAETCAGGLRCLAAAVTGDWRQPDPGCPLLEGGTGARLRGPRSAV